MLNGAKKEKKGDSLTPTWEVTFCLTVIMRHVFVTEEENDYCGGVTFRGGEASECYAGINKFTRQGGKVFRG